MSTKRLDQPIEPIEPFELTKPMEGCSLSMGKALRNPHRVLIPSPQSLLSDKERIPERLWSGSRLWRLKA
jgi:hypothetical protein